MENEELNFKAIFVYPESTYPDLNKFVDCAVLGIEPTLKLITNYENR